MIRKHPFWLLINKITPTEWINTCLCVTICVVDFIERQKKSGPKKLSYFWSSVWILHFWWYSTTIFTVLSVKYHHKINWLLTFFKENMFPWYVLKYTNKKRRQQLKKYIVLLKKKKSAHKVHSCTKMKVLSHPTPWLIHLECTYCTYICTCIMPPPIWGTWNFETLPWP